ncbi:MAG TPA: DUF4056 domain-containing protein [Tepidisphaeraceae bacterium]
MLLSLFVVSAGCTGPSRPRPRVGSLPYPGFLTLYAVADPQHLGPHQSQRLVALPFTPTEVDRGIMYSRSGGFLDVAHIRKAIDWNHYVYAQIRDALKDKRPGLVFEGPDLVAYHLTFTYPPDWANGSEADQSNAQDLLPIVLSQHITYGMMTWHEVQTWYGYKSGAIFSEQASAFSYDDAMSHWVGITVAGKVLRDLQRDPLRDFDSSVTETLSATLASLGATKPDDTHRIVMSLEGSWWKDGQPLKRQVHVGLAEGYIRPLLVPAESGPLGDVGQRYPLPTLDNVNGRSFRSFCRVELELRCWEADTIRQRLPGTPEWIDMDRDIPRLIDDIQSAVDRQNPSPTALTRRTDDSSFP